MQTDLQSVMSPPAARLPVPRAGEGFSIESGYFVMTMMPSLFCHLRCPHCYLSLEQRRDKTMLSVEDVALTCRKVDAYWDGRGIATRTVVVYWYGGEPTSMGTALFREMVAAMGEVFSADKGYAVTHVVLTSLVSVRDDWFEVFHDLCGGFVQSSYDGPMRGSSYDVKWARRMRAARESGLRMGTISVVNRALLDMGAPAVLDHLASLGVVEASFLPFMLNDQNRVTGKYDEFAPSMREWSAFMVAMTEHWLSRRRLGDAVPMIGQMAFSVSQGRRPLLANIAAQTLFLLPNGDFVLPDYRDGWNEYMRPFGNILGQDFGEVLASPERRAYLRRQGLRNGNPECLACDHPGHCVMEFWKPNREGDDCFGGRDYMDWLVANAARIAPFVDADEMTLY